jgi:hypothetical protein
MKNPEEVLLRETIRDLFSLVKAKSTKKAKNEESILREHIRSLIRIELLNEAGVPDSDPAPHKSTGINVLEDLLKKIIPTIEDDFKLLTTDAEQRKSYRAHIINATINALRPVEANNEAGEDDPGLNEEDELEEKLTIKVGSGGDSDLDKFIDINPEDTDAEDEEEKEVDPRDEFGIEGEDTTGRNMAFTTFKKIQNQIIDAYDLLSNAEDQELFIDYLVANLKLYFDKFEDEMSPSIEEPSNQAYDTAKQDQPEDDGLGDLGDLQLQEEIIFEF